MAVKQEYVWEVYLQDGDARFTEQIVAKTAEQVLTVIQNLWPSRQIIFLSRESTVSVVVE
jgi:hypothetical protein